ncbi:MAG: type II toxin-antitoxin system VapC family toxin [Gemmataceae bacterium]
MNDASLYQLDTNILVHYIRHSAVWRHVRDTYQLLLIEPTPRICSVSEGELRSLALQWRWGARRLGQVEYCLGYFPRHTIDTPRVMEMYAVIDAYCESIGQPMGKNDLWIAATAAVTGATLLTTDRDFDRLAPRLLSHIWIDPDIR